jgi:hypothetical protein
MTALAILACVVVIAALIQGGIGVGFALIVAPVAAVLRPDLLPGAVLIMMLPLNAYVAWRERHHFDLPSAGWITGGRVVGTFGGLWILLVVTTATLDLLVGITTILAAAATKLAPKFSPNHSAYVSAGLITGVTETATGIGGPPLALVYQHHPGPALRATIALCFLVGELFSLAVLAAEHRLSFGQLRDAILLMPPLALGLAVSGVVHRWLSAQHLRDALLLFAVLSGVLLIVQSAASK